MNDDARKFFFDALTTPSPSGYEEQIRDLVRERMTPLADDVRTDVHGNVIVAKNPDAPLRVMLAGHCDQIGLVVQYIDDQGYLWVLQLGGWDTQMLIGQRLKIWTDNGPISGVIARKPIHLLTEEERKQVPKLKDLWVDIGAKDREEAQSMVQVGDPITVELEPREMPNNRVVSPAMDDKCGMWVVMEALARVDASKLNCAVYSVATVQEEVGLRGAQTSAYGVDPHVGIAVDVTFATDCPTIEKKLNGEIDLGGGPVVYRGPNMNRHVVSRLFAAAEANDIPVQRAADGRPTGTDANAIQITRAGVAAGLVSIPNRYMHSPVEMVSLDDLDHAADLLARFLEAIEPDADFTP